MSIINEILMGFGIFFFAFCLLLICAGIFCAFFGVRHPEDVLDKYDIDGLHEPENDEYNFGHNVPEEEGEEE